MAISTLWSCTHAPAIPLMVSDAFAIPCVTASSKLVELVEMISITLATAAQDPPNANRHSRPRLPFCIEQAVFATKLGAKHKSSGLRIAREPVWVESFGMGIPHEPRMSSGVDGGGVSSAKNVSRRGCSLRISLSR